MAATSRMVLGECPAHAHVPELPARGPHAEMIGRALGMVDDLGVDRQPTGWRLIDHPGLDQRRAAATLRDDLEIFAEAAQDFTGEIVLTTAGPWTAAALVELSRGTTVIADTGARRDLAQALGAGVAERATRLQRLVPTARVRVQLDEPMLPMVAEGRVRTASGFRRHRSIDQPELETTLSRFIDDVRATGHRAVTLHCCAPGFDPGLAGRIGADLAMDLSGDISGAVLDAVAAHLERDGMVWWGLAATAVPDRVPRPIMLRRHATRLIEALELPTERWLNQVVLTPACGMAGWSLHPAIGLIRTVAETARDLSEDIGSR